MPKETTSKSTLRLHAPVVSPVRSTPVALRVRPRSWLGDMEEKGVVEKVDGPT